MANGCYIEWGLELLSTFVPQTYTENKMKQCSVLYSQSSLVWLFSVGLDKCQNLISLNFGLSDNLLVVT